MEIANDVPDNNIIFDPLGVDPLGATGNNAIDDGNSHSKSTVKKASADTGDLDDFESQIDSLSVNSTVKSISQIIAEKEANQVDSSTGNNSVKSKGKRIYRKRRQKLKDDSTSDDSSDDGFESKRTKLETDNLSTKSNCTEESEGTLDSNSRSRRSSRKSRPNNFYTNFELESGSGSEKEKLSYKGVKLPDDEYTPVKEKKGRLAKTSTGKKAKRKLSESEPPSGPPTAVVTSVNITDTISNFSNEHFLNVTPAANSTKDPPAVLDCSETVVDPATDESVKESLILLQNSDISVHPFNSNSGITDIKITSVSSMAVAKTPIVNAANMFKEAQMNSACSFIKDALKTTAELGTLLNSKANEFVEKKTTTDFMTDIRKLQFCMEKAFVLFNLARSNLSGIEKKLKKDFAEFMVTNNYDKLLKRDKNTNAFLGKHNITLEPLVVKSCPEPQLDSDSDCEIIEEESTQPKPSLRTLPELDILRRVEKNGISWKANTGGSISSDSDGGQKINLPGKNAVWINKDIQVKKVTPTKNYNRSFFREDGRTLKPPDIKERLASTKQVDKTVLILGWLDLAYKQAGDNFFSILKKMEKQKRYDSCSDLGESCSDDEVDNLPMFLQNYIFGKNRIMSLLNNPESLMKMCLNKINESFLQSHTHARKSLEKKFNFHLFDDFEFGLPTDCENVTKAKCLIPHEDNISSINFLSAEMVVVDSDDTQTCKISSIDESSKIMENHTLDVINASADVDTTIKLEQALKDLLKSSSENDDDTHEVNAQRKKRFSKTMKKLNSSHKYSNSNISPPVSWELSKLSCGSESSEDFSEYSHLKTDPKLKYESFVNIHPLSADLLKPFEDYIKEIEQDKEIERLIDLSTLIRHKNTSLNAVNVNKTEESYKKVKQNKKIPAENSLLNFMTSNEISSGIVKDPPCKTEAKEEETEQPIEKLALNFQKQSNSLAKDLLVGSSSNESSDEVSITCSENNSISVKKNTKATSDSDGSVITALSKKGEVESSQRSDEEIELKTPEKNIKSVKCKQKPDDLLIEISKIIRSGSNQRRKKIKSRNDSGDEKSRWLKKKNRMLSSEKRKTAKSDTDKDSDHSASSSESANSQILQTSADTLSPLTNIKSNNDLSSHQSSPFTPKTRNILAQSDLLSDSSEGSSCSDTLSRTHSLSPTKLVTSTMVILETPSKGRKNIRKMINDDFLMDTTKLAAKEEEDRLQRLIEKKSQLTELISQFPPKKIENFTGPSLVLDFDVDTKMPLVAVHPGLVKILKAHQLDGVKFMWDTCFESVQMVNDSKPGGGCILAHCMGLGKSLQVIALVHTILTSDLLSLHTVLICCPLSTVLNWADEFQKWLKKIGCANSVKVFELSKFKKNYERGFHLEDWHKTGGVFIIGYEMFRLLTTLKEAPKVKPHVLKKIYTTLLYPGPDIVVCDEGHLLKNDNTALAKVMNKIRTRRRIVLTGTPLQNNLKEYYCMVNFVKPSLLGSRREYFNRFENPISNGQHRDSSSQDIKIMKKRSHVLHKMLEGCVQRKEANILYKYLPRKLEYVLLTTLSECQVKMYQHYLERFARLNNTSKGTSLLKDFHILQKIWTHPRTLQQFLIKSREKKLNKEKGKKNTMFYQKKMVNGGFVCLEDDGLVAEETFAEPDHSYWWRSYVDSEALESLKTSPKFSVAFNLLDESLQAGDKMLIFCTSLFTLDALEYFLRKIKDWKLGRDYYRLDGSVTLENRQNWCRHFNSDHNKEVKLFLISTRAGGLGINMIAANRVIIMDVSWNPSHDVQSIFRIYRFGQKKDCFIYRLVTLGTMEEKMYERSVTKQAVSCRVVDEQQIDRHYNMADLSELYCFNPIPSGPQPIPSFPSDHVLATVLANHCQSNKNCHSVNRVVDEHSASLVDNHVNRRLSEDNLPKCQVNETQSTTDLVIEKLNIDDHLENLPNVLDNDNHLGCNTISTENSTNITVSGFSVSQNIVVSECLNSHLATVTGCSDGHDSTASFPAAIKESLNTTNEILANNGCNVSDNLVNDRCLPFVWSMHEHDSLLRDLHEEQLDEDDRQTAWLEYEAERELNRQAARPNAETILPHPKRPNIKHFRPNTVFPVGQILPNQSRFVPTFNHNLLGTHEGISILPDSEGSILPQNRAMNTHSVYRQLSRPRLVPVRRNNLINNPVAPQRPYLMGRYKPTKTEVSKSTAIANNAFKNIQISNITGFSSAISVNNEKRKRRKRKALSYFPSVDVSTSASSVMDLTSLPDTPDKEKQSNMKKDSSEKRSKDRTPGKTPKRINRQSSHSYRNSPSKNKRHHFTKKLSFGNEKNDIIPLQSTNKGPEAILPDNSKENAAMLTIELE